MEVAVYGAGAIGSLVGARLHEAGASVRLIGRQDHVDAIRANGLLLKDQDETRRVRLPATTTLPDDADVILLTVKSQDVTSACRDIAGLPSSATVVTMQNGVRSDGEAAGILGRDRIVGCVLNISATYLEPGVVEQNTSALLQVGAPFPESTARVDRARPRYHPRPLDEADGEPEQRHHGDHRVADWKSAAPPRAGAAIDCNDS